MNQTLQAKLKKAYAQGLERGRTFGAPLTASRQYWHDAARCLALALDWPKEAIFQKVIAFHKERLDATPDPKVYPELKNARELLQEEYRGMCDAGMDETSLALSESLFFWRDVRLLQETGKAWHATTMPEKCRVLYAPRSDQGALHAKNVDDPLTYWKPGPPIPKGTPWPHNHPLVFDGVGSGLHLDEIPPEIFPVNAIALCREHCGTVKQAAEFLVRYNYFWSSQNLLVHDHDGNSVAFEKTRCRVATRGPNARGINFITGMGAFDPGLRVFQNAQREKYLKQIGAGQDCLHACFWRMCQGKWDNMQRYVGELSANPTVKEVMALMEKRDENGPMCLTGKKCHPDDVAPGCTLLMNLWFMDQKQLHRRQWRGTTPAYLDAPEIIQFGS